MKHIFALLIIVLPLCSLADVYKWIDDQGNVHYGDKPVTGDSEKVQINTTTTPAGPDRASRDEMRQRVSDSMEEDRLAKKEAREKKKQEREKKLKECNWLKDKQRRFMSASGVYSLDKDGNRVFMSDEARKNTEQALSNKIKRACN